MTTLIETSDIHNFLQSLHPDQHGMLIQYLNKQSERARNRFLTDPHTKFEETYFFSFNWALMSIVIGYFPDMENGFMIGKIIVYDNVFEYKVWQSVHFKDQPPVKETLHLFN